jgi:hypothetical protein
MILPSLILYSVITAIPSIPSSFTAACLFDDPTLSAIVPGLQIVQAKALGLRIGSTAEIKDSLIKVESSSAKETAILVKVVHQPKLRSYNQLRERIHVCYGEPDDTKSNGQLIWEQSIEQPFTITLTDRLHPVIEFSFEREDDSKFFWISLPDVGEFLVEPIYSEKKFRGLMVKRIVAFREEFQPKKLWVGFKSKRFVNEGDYRLLPNERPLVLVFRDGKTESFMHFKSQQQKIPIVIMDAPRSGTIRDVGPIPKEIEDDLDKALERTKARTPRP